MIADSLGFRSPHLLAQEGSLRQAVQSRHQHDYFPSNAIPLSRRQFSSRQTLPQAPARSDRLCLLCGRGPLSFL